VAKNKDDIGLSILLEMDGEVFPMDNGYWTKFSIKKVEPDGIFLMELSTR
jgi:hypothetical protein